MRLSLLFAVAAVLSACSGPKLPAPNSADVRYDPGERAVQLMVSGLQPASAAALVADDGARYPPPGSRSSAGRTCFTTRRRPLDWEWVALAFQAAAAGLVRE